MERQAPGPFRYELVSEEGEHVGEVAAEEIEVGDLVGCGKHTFEVRAVDGSTLQVRRVI